MIKGKIANRVVAGDDGLYVGTIAHIGFETVIGSTKNGKTTDEYDRFELVGDFEGVTDPIQIKIMSGSTINDDPVKVIAAGRGKKNEKPVYNRFTTILLQLGILTPEKLAKLSQVIADQAMADLDKLVGRKIRCMIGKNAEGFYAIDINTLELINEVKQKWLI